MVSIPVRVIRCRFTEAGGDVKIVGIQYCDKWYGEYGVSVSEFNGERRV